MVEVVTAAAVVGLGGFLAGAITGKCVDFRIVSFGCSVDTVTENYTKLVDRVTNSTVVEATTSITTTTVLDQEMEIIYGKSPVVINPVYDQTISGDITLITSIDEDLSSAINQALKTEVTERFSDIKESKGILAPALNGSTIQRFETEVLRIIDEKTSVKSLKQIKTNVKVGQVMRVRYRDYATVINPHYNQNINVQVFIENVLQSIISAVSDLEVVNEIIKEVTTERSADSSGSEKTLFFVAALVLIFVLYKSGVFGSKKK